MSDSNRGKRGIIGAVIVGAVLMAVPVGAVWYAISQTSENWQQAQQNTQEIQAKANSYILESCGRMNPANAQECISNAHQTAADKERDEADLYAQRQMAVWALVMAVTTLVSIPLSLTGIFFVWRSLEEMAAQREISRNALHSTAHANLIQRRLAEADYGPKVKFLNCRAEITERSVSVWTEVANTGKSTALGVTLRIQARLLKSPDDGQYGSTPIFAEPGEFDPVIDLAAGESRHIFALCRFTDEWALDEVWKKPYLVNISGRVAWESRFSQGHERGIKFEPRTFRKKRVGGHFVWRTTADTITRYEKQKDA